jgi:hypothetical protein
VNRVLTSLVLVLTVTACSSAVHIPDVQRPPPTVIPDRPNNKLLFERTNAMQVHIWGTSVPDLCQVIAQFQQGQQSQSLGGMEPPVQNGLLLQIGEVGPDWLIAHTGPGVADVRWVDTAGRHDEMKPVDGWVALAGTMVGFFGVPNPPEPSLNSVLTAYSSSGHQIDSLTIGPLPQRPNPTCAGTS